jgi:hypothetical protein
MPNRFHTVVLDDAFTSHGYAFRTQASCKNDLLPIGKHPEHTQDDFEPQTM